MAKGKRQLNRKSHRRPGGGGGGPLRLYGLHPVRAAIENDARVLRRLWAAAEARERLASTLSAAGRRRLEGIAAATAERRELDALVGDGAVHQGVVLEVEPLDAPVLEDVVRFAREDAAAVLLDQVTDPQNVGAILRSAAVFGALAVITTDRNAPDESGALAKAAAGALETVPYVRVPNLARGLEILKEAGFWAVGLAGEAERTLAQVDLGPRLAIVMGAEGPGMRRLTREHCDMLARIPSPGLDESSAIDSLNVSTAAAVALYELIGRRRSDG